MRPRALGLQNTDNGTDDSVTRNGGKDHKSQESMNFLESTRAVLEPHIFFVWVQSLFLQKHGQPCDLSPLLKLCHCFAIKACFQTDATQRRRSDIIHTPLSIARFVQGQRPQGCPWLSHAFRGMGQIIPRVSPHIPANRKGDTLRHATRFGKFLGFRHPSQNEHDAVGSVRIGVRRSTMKGIHIHEQGIARRPNAVFIYQLKAFLAAQVHFDSTATIMRARASSSSSHFLGGVLELNKDRIRRTKRTGVTNR
mmetsp:Transcript_5157/g.9888  ORF Transcript_5157/g.9888 Transcript_5157/m.9888 type:complete len:252 (-) Transcript_5157:271-1026(-)